MATEKLSIAEMENMSVSELKTLADGAYSYWQKVISVLSYKEMKQDEELNV